MFISKYLLRRYVSERWCIVTYSYSPLIVTNCNNECHQIRKKSQLYKHLLSIVNLNLDVEGKLWVDNWEQEKENASVFAIATVYVCFTKNINDKNVREEIKFYLIC